MAGNKRLNCLFVWLAFRSRSVASIFANDVFSMRKVGNKFVERRCFYSLSYDCDASQRDETPFGPPKSSKHYILDERCTTRAIQAL